MDGSTRYSNTAVIWLGGVRAFQFRTTVRFGRSGMYVLKANSTAYEVRTSAKRLEQNPDLLNVIYAAEEAELP